MNHKSNKTSKQQSIKQQKIKSLSRKKRSISTTTRPKRVPHLLINIFFTISPKLILLQPTLRQFSTLPQLHETPAETPSQLPQRPQRATINFTDALLDWDRLGERHSLAKRNTNKDEDYSSTVSDHEQVVQTTIKPSPPKTAFSTLYDTSFEEKLFEGDDYVADEDENTLTPAPSNKPKQRPPKSRYPAHCPYYDPTTSPSTEDLIHELQQTSRSYRQVTKSAEILHVLGTFVGTFDLLPQLTRRIFQLSKQITDYSEKYELTHTPYVKKLFIDTVVPPFTSSSSSNANTLTKRTLALSNQQQGQKNKKGKKNASNASNEKSEKSAPSAKEIDYQRLVRLAQNNLINAKETAYGNYGTNYSTADLTLGFHRISDGSNVLQMKDILDNSVDNNENSTSKGKVGSSIVEFIAIHRALLPDRIVFNMTLHSLIKNVSNAFPSSNQNPFPLPSPSLFDAKSTTHHHAVINKQKESRLGNLLNKFDKSAEHQDGKLKHQKGLQLYYKHTAKLFPTQAQINPADHPSITLAFEIIDYMISASFNSTILQDFLVQRQQLYLSSASGQSQEVATANMDEYKRVALLKVIEKNQHRISKTGASSPKADLKARFKPFFEEQDDVFEEDYYRKQPLGDDDEGLDNMKSPTQEQNVSVQIPPIDMTPQVVEYVDQICENSTPQLDTFFTVLKFAAEQGDLTITSAALLRIIHLDLLYLNRLDYTIKKHRGDIAGAEKLQNDFDEVEKLLFAGLSNNGPILPSQYAQFTTFANYLGSNSISRRTEIPSPLELAQHQHNNQLIESGQEVKFDPTSFSPIQRNPWLAWVFPPHILHKSHPLVKNIDVDDLLNLPTLDTSRWTTGALVPGRVPTPPHFLQTALRSCVQSPSFLEAAFGSALPNIQVINTHLLSKRPEWQQIEFAEDLLNTIAPKKQNQNNPQQDKEKGESSTPQDDKILSSLIFHPTTTASLPNPQLLDQMRIAIRFWSSTQLSKSFTRLHNLQGHFTNAVGQLLQHHYNPKPDVTSENLHKQYVTTPKSFSDYQFEDPITSSGSIPVDVFQSMFSLAQQLPAHTNTLAHRHLLNPIVIPSIHDPNLPTTNIQDPQQVQLLAHANTSLEYFQKLLYEYGIVSLESQEPNPLQQPHKKQAPLFVTDRGLQLNLHEIFPPTSLDNLISSDKTINHVLSHIPPVQIPQRIQQLLLNPTKFNNIFVDLGAGDGEHSINHAQKSNDSSTKKPDLVLSCDILPQRLSKMLSTYHQRRNPVPSTLNHTSETSALDLFTIPSEETQQVDPTSFKLSPALTESVVALAKRIYVDAQQTHKATTPNIPFSMSMNECLDDVLHLFQGHVQSNLPFFAHHQIDSGRAIQDHKYPPQVMERMNAIANKYPSTQMDLIKLTAPRNLFAQAQLPPRVLLPTPYDAPSNQDPHQGIQNLFAFCGKASSLLSTLPVNSVHTINLTHPPPPTTDSYFTHHSQGHRSGGLDPDATLLSEHLLLLAARALRPQGSIFIISDDQRVAAFLDRVLTPGLLSQPNANVQLELADYFKMEELRIDENGQDEFDIQSRYQKMHAEGKIPNQRPNKDGSSRAWRLVRRQKTWQ